MNKRLIISLLTLLFSTALPTPSWAETVIEKVIRTGVLTAGTRTDAVPFAYVNANGELVGYSVDIINLIRNQLEKELGKKIELELVEVTAEDRIPKVVSQEVDLVCDFSSFTWDREKYVDFSTSYGVSGTRILVKQASNLSSPESLSSKRIGVISGTTNEQVIKLLQPQATLVPVKDSKNAISDLEAGKIDAFAWDGGLLEGLRQTTSKPDAFKVVPEKPYAREGIACMLPQNDSSFRNLVDYTLVKFMQGVVLEDSQDLAIFDRWFGSKGIIPVNRDVVLPFFQFMVDTHEQIPMTKN